MHLLYFACLHRPKVLQNHPEASRATHIIGDLNSYLTESKLRELDALTPRPNASNEERFELYETMGRVIREDPNSFREFTPCICHPRDAGAHLDTLDGTHVRAGHPITVWVAGSECTDFSRRGLQQRTAGTRMRPYKIWSSLVLKKLPDVVIHEITVDQAALAMLHRDFAEEYDIRQALRLSLSRSLCSVHRSSASHRALASSDM